MNTGKRVGIAAGSALVLAALGVGLAALLSSRPNRPPDVTILSPVVEVGTELVSQGCTAHAVHLTGTVSDSDGDVVSCTWSFDDGVTRHVDPDTLAQHRVYEQGGDHWARLTATDNDGASAEAVVTFHLNEPPVASIRPKETWGRAPLEIEYSAASSVDSDGEVAEYEWDLDGDGHPDAWGVTAAVVFDEAGSHRVSVWAIDDAGARSVPAIAAAQVWPVSEEPIPDTVRVIDFGECSAVVWDEPQTLWSQQRTWYHVNVASYPQPYIDWESYASSPPLTVSGVFNNPESASAAEYCLDEEPGKALGLDYDVTVPGSYAGFYLQLDKENPDLQRLLLDHEAYALGVRLKGTPNKVKIELKLPGVGWLSYYQDVDSNEWVDCSIPLVAFNFLEDCPSSEPMQFVLTLENRAITAGKLEGTVVLDDLVFTPSTSEGASAQSRDDEGERVWLDVADPEGDDHGPGTYVYPLHSLFRQETFDLVRFRVLEDAEDVIFEFQLGGRLRNPWDAPNGFSIQAFDVYLDTTPGGYQDLIFDRTIPENVSLNPNGSLNAQIGSDRGWDVALRLQGWESAIFTSPSGLDGAKDLISSSIEVFASSGLVVGRVPKRIIGDPSSDWRISAFSFGIDRGNARLVSTRATDWEFGGGTSGHDDPNIIDLIVPDGVEQEAALDYLDSAPVELPMIELRNAVGNESLADAVGSQTSAVVEPSRLGEGPLEEILDQVQLRAAHYFWTQASSQTGLVKDRSTDASSSIAAVGFGLTVLCTAAEHEWTLEDDPAWDPEAAVYDRVRTTLLFLRDGVETEHGFFWHFLDMESGQASGPMREVSSIDTALLLAGVLFAGEYFAGTEIESLAQEIYDRADWTWFTNGGETLCMSWTPESGFSSSKWDTYSELMIAYLLGLGSSTHPLSPDSWTAWGRPVRSVEGIGDYIYELGGESLFVHLFSHGWVDFRDKHDAFADYFQNTVAAVQANRAFVSDHAQEFEAFGDDLWGLTAGDGPAGYRHYGALKGHTDGTINPYGLIAAMPFSPDASEKGIRTLLTKYGDRVWGEFGFYSGFKPDASWYSTETIGIDQGITFLMLENHRTGFIWELFTQIPAIQTALQRAGFVSGSLEGRTLTSAYEETLKLERDSRKRTIALRAAAPLRIDGDLSDWESLGGLRNVVDEKMIVLGSLRPEQELRSMFSVSWDDENLYLACEVTDDAIVASISSDDLRDFWRTDSAEFYVDPSPFDPAEPGRLLKIAAIPADTDGNAQAVRHEDANPGPVSSVAPNLAFAAACTDDGYAIELSIPWQELGITAPRQGLRLGLSHAVHSADQVGLPRSGSDIRTVMLAWTPTPDVWANPNSWGVVVLQ